MAVKINYTSKQNEDQSGNTVLFVDEKFDLRALKKSFSNNEFTYINDLLKTSDLKKNIFVFEVNSKKKIILISIKKNLKTSDIENLGAEFYGRVNYGKNSSYLLYSDSIVGKDEIFFKSFSTWP